jgi:hypothetical protein
MRKIFRVGAQALETDPFWTEPRRLLTPAVVAVNLNFMEFIVGRANYLQSLPEIYEHFFMEVVS